MSNSVQKSGGQSVGEVGFREIVKVIWVKKLFVIAITLLAAAISTGAALTSPNIYTATALLAPADAERGGLSTLASQYGGLASLAGVSLPSSAHGLTTRYAIELMQSRAFLKEFIERRGLLPELMGGGAWDLASGEMKIDPDLYDVSLKKWVRPVNPPKTAIPTWLEAHKAFTAIMTISQEAKTGYVSVSISHKSPVLAARWVTWIIEDVNAAVKAQVVQEATRSIEYLERQVAQTSLADLQAVFFELIQSQTETVMLAQIRPEYVFKTIDPAFVPEERSSPNRAFISLAGTFVGGMLGVLLALGRNYSRYW